MTFLVCILGGLACVGIGVAVGYRICAHINGNVFQAFYDNGTMVIETEDGWDGTKEAWLSLAKFLEMKAK
jgi:hypothetical protein